MPEYYGKVNEGATGIEGDELLDIFVNIDMKSNRIKNLEDPIDDMDVVNKRYLTNIGIGGGAGATGFTGATGSVTVSGSDKQIIYNNNGSLSGATGFIYDYTVDRVGIGTASPITTLTVNGVTTQMAIGGEGGQINFNNPDNASSGLTVDVRTANVGRIFNAANNSTIQIGQLVGTGGTIQLYTGSSERMRINSLGKIGINTSDPFDTLSINGSLTLGNPVYTGTSGAFRILHFSGNTFFQFGQNYSDESASNLIFSAMYSTSEWMRLTNVGYLLIGYSSSNGSYKLQVNSQIFATNSTIATSDGRYKTDIKPLESSLSLINKLNPVSFNWKKHNIHDFDKSNQVGFIAQEVQEVLKDEPFVNSIIKLNKTENEEFYGMSETKLIPILVKAIQELTQEIEKIKGK